MPFLRPPRIGRAAETMAIDAATRESLELTCTTGGVRKGSLLDAEGWFNTRDGGYLDEGGYLFLEGRMDDVIVRGGENMSPGEIEDVLLTLFTTPAFILHLAIQLKQLL